MAAKKKKMTYNELLSAMENYVSYLDKKFIHHLNTTNKTLELYIDFKKDDKDFTNFINKRQQRIPFPEFLNWRKFMDSKLKENLSKFIKESNNGNKENEKES